MSQAHIFIEFYQIPFLWFSLDFHCLNEVRLFSSKRNSFIQSMPDSMWSEPSKSSSRLNQLAIVFSVASRKREKTILIARVRSHSRLCCTPQTITPSSKNVNANRRYSVVSLPMQPHNRSLYRRMPWKKHDNFTCSSKFIYSDSKYAINWRNSLSLNAHPEHTIANTRQNE